MNEYKFSVEVEPSDNFKKAQKDMLNFHKSWQLLNADEKQRLLRQAIALIGISPDNAEMILNHFK